MRDEDLSYYQMRAEAELEQAQQSSHPEAVKAHYLLAGMYLDMVHRELTPAE
jgi:hypothetical protein